MSEWKRILAAIAVAVIAVAIWVCGQSEQVPTLNNVIEIESTDVPEIKPAESVIEPQPTLKGKGCN